MSDLTCGVDVGGTKILAAVVDPQGAVVEEIRRDSPAYDLAAVRRVIVESVQDLRARHAVNAVGVGVAGYVDRDRATVLFGPNIPWRDTPLKAGLEAALDLPVVIENDANAAAWGEYRFGAGRGCTDMLMITVGTGVGGGIVLGGELFRGAYGVAAEIGHLRVVPDGELCGCGQRGCLEMYGSGNALVRRVGGDLDGPAVTAAARAGDRACLDALAETGRWLGEASVSLAAVLDPGRIVVGGGVAEAGDLLLGPMREAFHARLTGVGYRREAGITGATLGNRAGVIGAADLARS